MRIDFCHLTSFIAGPVSCTGGLCASFIGLPAWHSLLSHLKENKMLETKTQIFLMQVLPQQETNLSMILVTNSHHSDVRYLFTLSMVDAKSWYEIFSNYGSFFFLWLLSLDIGSFSRISVLQNSPFYSLINGIKCQSYITVMSRLMWLIVYVDIRLSICISLFVF